MLLFLAGRFMVNLPFSSVVVLTGFPTTCTTAPGTGRFFSSRTVPFSTRAVVSDGFDEEVLVRLLPVLAGTADLTGSGLGGIFTDVSGVAGVFLTVSGGLTGREVLSVRRRTVSVLI